ncbi:hypothetical protein B0H17DRAFT_409591 [Mycena rosella]|uniref:Uncharacterized protein n=1 Tax=Mycena rosella TaxID=1033263 RepID=A0AAD7CLK7_MYCRO|nr:hypothetical protein B0H17DRAFT_409591 [Mycena rosella]
MRTLRRGRGETDLCCLLLGIRLGLDRVKPVLRETIKFAARFRVKTMAMSLAMSTVAMSIRFDPPNGAAK